jgi:hypothetical protein
VRKREQERVAREICDEILGPIPRDKDTLGALEVARVMLTAGRDRQRLDAIRETMTQLWHNRASEHEADVIWRSGEESDDNAYLDVFNTVHVAFSEVERRVLFGQPIPDAKFDELLFSLRDCLTHQSLKQHCLNGEMRCNHQAAVGRDCLS